MVGHSLVQIAVAAAQAHCEAALLVQMACFQSACAAELVRW